MGKGCIYSKYLKNPCIRGNSSCSTNREHVCSLSKTSGSNLNYIPIDRSHREHSNDAQIYGEKCGKGCHILEIPAKFLNNR